MIIQPLLTLLLLGILFFSIRQRRIGRTLRFFVATCIAAGIVMIWMPHWSSIVANVLGVGRGADLVMYLWILFSLQAFVYLYISIKRKERQITELTRALAISNAKKLN